MAYVTGQIMNEIIYGLRRTSPCLSDCHYSVMIPGVLSERWSFGNSASELGHLSVFCIHNRCSYYS